MLKSSAFCPRLTQFEFNRLHLESFHLFPECLAAGAEEIGSLGDAPACALQCPLNVQPFRLLDPGLQGCEGAAKFTRPLFSARARASDREIDNSFIASATACSR